VGPCCPFCPCIWNQGDYNSSWNRPDSNDCREARGFQAESRTMGILTVKQAAERLQVAATTIYNLCARKVLRHIRVGRGRGTIRIRQTDLDAFLEVATVQPAEPAAPKPPRAKLKRSPAITLKNLSLS